MGEKRGFDKENDPHVVGITIFKCSNPHISPTFARIHTTGAKH